MSPRRPKTHIIHQPLVMTHIPVSAQAERLMKRLGIDKNVQLTDYEMSIACQLVEPVSIQVSWDSIAG